MTTENDMLGLEFDWLAVDVDGSVALLTTAGAGYAPLETRQSVEEYDAAIDRILAMPIRSDVRCFRELRPGLTNTWKLVAERGVYAFDSDPLGGPYRIIAIPSFPIKVTELPEQAAIIANRMIYLLQFCASSELTEEQLHI